MVFCSETRTTEKLLNEELMIKTYKLIRCDSHSRHTGGVMIYIHESLEYKIICNKNVEKNMWCIVIKLMKTSRNWKICVLYHSPNASDSDFITYVEKLINNHFQSTQYNVVVGDFNIDVEKDSSLSKNLSNIFAKNIV